MEISVIVDISNILLHKCKLEMECRFWFVF